MKDGTAEDLRERAQHCRDLAQVTRDSVVEQQLLSLAEEFDAEAEKVAKAQPKDG